MLELNKIYNENCLKGIERIPDKSIDLIITDPPYYFPHHLNRHDSDNVTSAFAKSALYLSEGKVIKDMGEFDEEKICEFLDVLPRIMKKMNGYFCCSEAQVVFYCNWAIRHKYFYSILVWEKPLSVINKNRYSQNLEYIVRIYTSGCGLNPVENNELYNKVVHSKVVEGKEKIHLTQKPISFMTKFLLLSSKENDTILDPFMGSGTTAIACIKEKRKFVGFELNKEYFDKACARIKKELSQPTLF